MNKKFLVVITIILITVITLCYFINTKKREYFQTPTTTSATTTTVATTTTRATNSDGQCLIDNTMGSNQIMCYYNRLTRGIYRNSINRYYSSNYLVEPNEYEDSFGQRTMLMAFYLQYNFVDGDNVFPRIGCGTGWVNKIGNSNNLVISEWAFYLYRCLSDRRITFPTLKFSSSINLSGNRNLFLIFKKNMSGEEDLRNFISTMTRQVTFNTLLDTYRNRDRVWTKIFLLNMLYYYIQNNTVDEYNSFYRWGIPTYYDSESINLRENQLGNSIFFNFKYNIIYDSTSMFGRRMCILKYNTQGANAPNLKWESIQISRYDNSGIDKFDTQADFKNDEYSFIFEFKIGCGHYLKIKIKIGNVYKYLKLNKAGDNFDFVSQFNEASEFFIDIENIETVNDDMKYDLRKIFIPYTNQPNWEERTGVNFSLFVRNNSKDISYLYSNKIISANNNTIVKNISYVRTSEIPDEAQIFNNSYGVDFDNIHKNSFLSFKLVSQGYAEFDPFYYKENRVRRTVSGKIIQKDLGVIKKKLDGSDKNVDNDTTINDIDNVSSNQKVFPVVNTNTERRQLDNKCIYKGKMNSNDAILNVCKNDGRCYGEFESQDDDYKRIYSGPLCNVPLKYIEKTGTQEQDKVNYGKIKCKSLYAEAVKEGSLLKANKCFIPKYRNNHQNQYNLRYNGAYESECIVNQDFGMLDGPINQMYVNNTNCEKEYKYLNNSLIGNEECREGTKCVFENTINDENKAYLSQTDFSKIENQNSLVNRKLTNLLSQLDVYEDSLNRRREADAKDNERLIGSLNDFKFIKLNDNLNRLNNEALNELIRQA